MQIQLALTNFQVLKIEYLSSKQVRTTRKIEPFALYSTQENWLLVAFCRLRKEFRVFRIDYIQKVTNTLEQFESHNMTLDEYFKKQTY